MENTKKNTRTSLFQMLNGRVFWIPAGILMLLVMWGFLSPYTFTAATSSGLSFILTYFNWFLVPLTFLTVMFCLWAAFSKYGNIRLGGENAKPKIKNLTWFAISLSSGMGVGIAYYATYQPLELFHNPPAFLTNVASQSPEAFTYAMRFSFIEWGLHPYALYTSFGVAIAFMFYNGKRRYRVSDGFYPLFGDKVNGKLGDFIDSFSLFVIVGGLAASAGLAIMQIGQGCNYLFGVGNSKGWWLIITAVIAVIYILDSTTGLHKLMSWFGNVNVFLYIAIMLFALIAIDFTGILEVFWSSLGDYLNTFISTSLTLEPLYDTGWIGNNNTFFFTWWMVFAPISGLFLVKLAYGRTLKEFILVNMILPALFVTLWFSIFGGGAILLEANTDAQIYDLIQEMGSSMAWYALFDNLPFSKFVNLIAWIIVILSFVTLAGSLTMSLAAMSCKNYSDTTGETQPPRILCVFWGILIAVLAYMLLYTGGIDSLQTAVVICGLPTGVLLLVMMLSHMKAMHHHKTYDLSDHPTKLKK